MARINAKSEFIDHVGNKKVKCALVEFISYVDSGKYFLTTGYTSDEYDEFLSKIDRFYDNGYGGQELDGMIWYEDGTWTTRGEYDGSEWWEYHEVPEIPDYLNRVDKVRDKKLSELL